MKQFSLIMMILFASLTTFAQTPYVMSTGNYSETFSTISTWTNAFASPTEATHWKGLAVNAVGTIPSALKITAQTTSFATSSTSGGVQRGGALSNPANTIVLLSTGSTDNSSSAAIELFLDFTGRVAGTISFDWQAVANSTGNRAGSLRLYTSIDGTNYTELTSAAVLNFLNNVVASGSVTTVALPSSFTNSSTARIRFYYHNGTGGSSGSRPKIAFTNLNITSTATSGATISVTPSTLSNFMQSSASPSALQSYNVSGIGFTSDLIITPSANFEISLDTITWVANPSTITLTHSGGTINSTPIYVRLNASSHGYFIGTISNASTGATSQDVIIDGAYPMHYYSGASGDLNLTTSWWSENNGTGTNPANFTTDAQIFHVQNNATPTISADWTVSGLYSKIVLGNGSEATTLTVPDPYKITGPIDLSALGKLSYASSTAPAHTYGTVSSNSTIEFAQTGTYTIPQTITYGNLSLVNGTKTFSGNTTTIAGSLTFDNMTIASPGSSPFATLNVAGNVTYLNSVVNPADANSITLVMSSAGTQTITANGNVIRFFRIQTSASGCNVVLASGASRNLSSTVLGNASGGGLQLATGSTFTINNNTLGFFAGKTTFIGTGKIIGSATSNIALNNSGSTASMGSMIFNTGDEILDSLTISISGTVPTVTLGSNLTVNSALNLNAGLLVLGANNVILGSSAVINGGSATSFIVPASTGVLRKPFTTASAYTFPVGDATPLYTPLTVRFNSGTFESASVDVKLSKTKHANNTSSTDYISRNWTIASNGITAFNANVMAQYNQADVTGTEANLIGGVWNGSLWTAYTTPDTVSDTLHFGNLTTFGDFTAGEQYVMNNAGRMTVTFIPEAYYNEVSNTLAISDTFKVYLADINSPFAFVDSANVVIDSLTFTGTATFANAASGTFYLVVKGRNSVQTWSKTGGEVYAKGATGTFNFTTAATQAFGSNLVLKGTKYCLYSGDVNQDGFIDFSDLTLIDNDSYNFASGYLETDVNGDMFVDFSDLTICDNNSYNFIGTVSPAGKRPAKQRILEYKPNEKLN